MEPQIMKSLLTTLFFFFSTFVMVSSSSSSTVWQPKPHIRKACRSTPYPRLCETSLTFYASQTKRTQQELCRAALVSSLKAAQNATSTISKLSRRKPPPLSPYEAEVVEDCIENLRTSVDELRRASNTIINLKRGYDVEFQISSVKTWVSAAETDVMTCTDGLSGGGGGGGRRQKVSSKVKSVVKKSSLDVVRQISNALSLINNFKYKS